MRILLIRNDSFQLPYEINITGIYPPLGLAYIAAVLRKEGYVVSILDNQVLRLQYASLKREIEEFSPDAVLLSAMTPLWPEVIRIGQLIKKISARIICRCRRAAFNSLSLFF